MLGRFNIVEVSIFPKLLYVFNTIPIKIPAGLSVELNKLILNFCMLT